MLEPSEPLDQERLDDICSVCLSDFSEGDTCVTQCQHTFCKGCLDAWFDSNHLTCPLCRTNIQYFRHQGIDKRIVCIYKRPDVRPAAPRIQRNTIVVSQRTLVTLNFFGFVSFTSLILSLYFWIRFYHMDPPDHPDHSDHP